jgi:hypothetical protein
MTSEPKFFTALWPFYLSQHSKRATRLMHLAGTCLGLLAIIAGFAGFGFGWLLMGPVILYGMAWIAQGRFMKRRFALTLIGFGFVLVAGVAAIDSYLIGFPDGHMTDFDLETRDLRKAAITANLTLCVLAWACGLSHWIKPSAALVLAVAAAFVVVAIPSVMLPDCPSMQFCVQIYETVTGHPPPDNGIGG